MVIISFQCVTVHVFCLQLMYMYKVCSMDIFLGRLSWLWIFHMYLQNIYVGWLLDITTCLFKETLCLYFVQYGLRDEIWPEKIPCLFYWSSPLKKLFRVPNIRQSSCYVTHWGLLINLITLNVLNFHVHVSRIWKMILLITYE